MNVSGVTDENPQVLLGELNYYFEAPKWFFNRKEMARYVVERMRVLSLLAEEDGPRMEIK